MPVINKIEIAGKCDPNHETRKSIITSLPTTINFTIWKYDSSTTQKTVVFEDKEILENGQRYAMILSKEDLNWPTEGVKAIEADWDKHYKGSSHFFVYLTEDDGGYDHVLTDVRYNNRSLNVPDNTYSVCSRWSDSSNYIDTYITVHTE